MIQFPNTNDNIHLIANKYRLFTKEKIGKGTFGEIYLGYFNRGNTSVPVGIKVENSNVPHPQLAFEAKIYAILKGGNGIPTIYWSGSEGSLNFLIMDVLGNSLENLFTACKMKFTLNTVCMIGEQMIERMEFIHSKNFIHRDIKPENFLIGIGKKKKIIYIIDFGLSKRFEDPKTGLHIPYRDGKTLTGTPKYSSINTHLGMEQSRRDDLEAITYVLLYFLKGELPWQGLKLKNVKDKYKKIGQMKMAISLEKLCEGLPYEFQFLLQYTRNLKFDEKPDYLLMKKLIKRIEEKNNLKCEVFDWDKENKNSQEDEEN